MMMIRKVGSAFLQNHFYRMEAVWEIFRILRLFKIGGTPVFFVDEEQQRCFQILYTKMMTEIQSDYVHKYDMLRAYLHLMIHETMKMHPAENLSLIRMPPKGCSLFMELLERQFPIDSPDASLN
jgi:hypothetical protein